MVLKNRCFLHKPKYIHGQQLQEKPLEVDDRIVAKLEEISTLSDVSSRRIAIFVKKCIQCGKEYFTAQEWSYVHERSLVSSNFDLRNARGYGLVKKCDDECTYSICLKMDDNERRGTLPDTQLLYLEQFHEQVGDNEFTGETFALFIQNSYPNALYYLKQFQKAELLEGRVDGGKTFFRFPSGIHDDEEQSLESSDQNKHIYYLPQVIEHDKQGQDISETAEPSLIAVN